MAGFDLPDRGYSLPWARNSYLNILRQVEPKVTRSLQTDVLPLYRACYSEIGFRLTNETLNLRQDSPLRLKEALAKWGKRWQLSDDWCTDVALRTLATWLDHPDHLDWSYLHIGFWFRDAVVPDLLALPRQKVEGLLTADGLTREAARTEIRTAAEVHRLVPLRTAKNIAHDEPRTLSRSLNWLARAVAGETATQIASSFATGRRYAAPPLPEAILLSNKRTAVYLGLTYRPRRGRPRKS